MKKLILLSAVLSISLISFAQKLQFSFHASPQLTWFSGSDDDYEANGTFLGINTGIEADIFFAEKYAFTTGISLYTVKGGAIYDDSLRFTINDSEKVLIPGSRMTNNLQYIAIPLGLKFKTIEIGYSTYWLNTGISPMIRLKSSVSDEEEVFSKIDFKDKTSLFNVGYFIQGGLEYSIGGSTALIAGLGFNTGFIDVTESKDDKFTTKSFSIILGVLF